MAAHTSLQDFAEHAASLAEEKGIAGFEPLICLPDAQQLAVIDDIPATVPHTAAIKHLLGHEQFAGKRVQFALRTGPDRLDVGELKPSGEVRWLSVMPDDDGDLVIALGTSEAYGWWTGEEDEPEG